MHMLQCTARLVLEHALWCRWLTHRPALSDPGEAVQPSKSLATPEAFRRMRNSEHQVPTPLRCYLLPHPYVAHMGLLLMWMRPRPGPSLPMR